MTYILRMTSPENHTNLADDLVELVNPSREELVAALRLLLSRGKVSCIITRDDGSVCFYAHDLVLSLVAYLQGV